ncbi:unnamed protein product [Auanema sp. JU1783]|nr:unnamed protein product [Auanema sp. JU1783]
MEVQLVFLSSNSLYNYPSISGALWCHQGSLKDFVPTQCAPQTLDCFKFSCDHKDAGFVARGCGVSLTRTATGLRNESCNQALAQCQALNGIGSCNVCSEKHMCNEETSYNIVTTFIVSIMISSLV